MALKTRSRGCWAGKEDEEEEEEEEEQEEGMGSDSIHAPPLLFVLLATPLPFTSSLSPEKHEVAQGECLASAASSDYALLSGLPLLPPSFGPHSLRPAAVIK